MAQKRRKNIFRFAKNIFSQFFLCFAKKKFIFFASRKKLLAYARSRRPSSARVRARWSAATTQRRHQRRWSAATTGAGTWGATETSATPASAQRADGRQELAGRRRGGPDARTLRSRVRNIFLLRKKNYRTSTMFAYFFLRKK